MKAPLCTFREYIRALSDTSCWEAGLELFTQGGVLDQRKAGAYSEFRVANEADRFERVQVRFSPSGLTARCSCRTPSGGLCPHAVAALLHWQGEHGDGAEKLMRQCTAPLPRVVSPDPAPPLPEAAAASAGPVVAVPPRAPVPLLQAVRVRKARLNLRIRGDYPAVASRWDRLVVEPELIGPERTYVGFSNVRRLAQGQTASGGLRLDHFSAQDRTLLRFLAERGRPESTGFVLAGPDAGDFFERACGHPRIRCDAGAVVIGGAFVEPVLLLGPADSENMRGLTPGFLARGHGLLPREHLAPVIGRATAWIGVKGMYARLTGRLDAATLKVFLAGQEAKASRQDVEGLVLAAARGASVVRTMDRSAVREVRLQTSRPRAVLRLDWQEGTIVARLAFRYGRIEIDPESTPACSFRRSTLLVRDLPAESAATDRLREWGFTPDSIGARLVYRLQGPDRLWHFLASPPAGFRGWDLRESPEISTRRNRLAEARLEVLSGIVRDDTLELEPVIQTHNGIRFGWDFFSKGALPPGGCLQTPEGDVVRLSDQAVRACAFLRDHGQTAPGGRVLLSRYMLPLAADVLGPGVRGVQKNAWIQLAHELTEPPRPDEGRTAHPISDRLRDYQRVGVAWIQRLERAGFHGILADEMGLGKTVQALAVLVRRHLIERVTRPSLVVCPSSLIDNWAMEAARFAPELQTIAVRGADREPLIRRLDRAHLAVTSYALLRRDADAYRGLAFDYVILDEAQHIKNPRTANARACKGLECRHRLILTGTPIENGPREIWSLLDFLLPGMLGPERDFRRLMEQGLEAEGTAMVRPFLLRRTKDAVAPELPPKQEQTLFCELTPRQAELYRHFLTDSRTLVQQAKETGWRTGRFHILALLTRLRQVCCHPGLLDPALREDAGDGETVSAKTALLKEVVLEALDSGRKMLIFSQFTSFLRLFRTWLEAEEVSFEYLDGQTTDRQARVDRFNRDPSMPVFLMSLRAGGTGLNLTGADLVVHYDSWWNPMVEDQASDRAHRIGQTRPVTVLKLVTKGTIEERVLALQARKRVLFDRLVGGAPGGLGALTAEDLAVLLPE